MSEMISSQAAYLLGSFIYGFGLLAAYDVIRVVRIFIPHLRAFVWLEDCLFWLLAAIIVFDMIYERNNGVLRGFSLAALCIGMVLYRVVIGDKIAKVMKKIQKLLKKKINHIIMRIRGRLQR